MSQATLTSKGQLTLPKAIREHLKVRTGDSIDFVIADDGSVYVRAGRVDVRELQGLLRRPGRKPVSIERMDETIRAAHGRH